MSGLARGGSQLHVDQHLTNLAINYRPGTMIADRIFPRVNVPKQTDSFLVWDQGDLWALHDTKRSPGTEAPKATISVTSDNFNCQNYAIKDAITVEDRANADPAFIRELEGGKTRRLMDWLNLDWERRIATQVTNTSNVGSSAAVGSSWQTLSSNSDPLGDVQTGIENVEDATGYRPNKVVFGGLAWRLFRKNPTIIDKTRATALTGADQYPNTALVAALLEVDEVMVGNAFYNSAEEAIDDSIVRIWDDHVLVYYSPNAPSLVEPAFGYSFRWNARGIANMTVTRHPFDTKLQSQEVEIGYYQDEKITSAPLSFLITNVSSST
jgi:hypothetical protein